MKKLLGLLVIVGLLAVAAFFVLGGRFDLDITGPSADVTVDQPEVNVSPGRLPSVSVG